MYDHTFSKLANHQIRHQGATHKVGSQPGDCTWSVQSSSGVCVGLYHYGLTNSLYHPEGVQHCGPIHLLKVDQPEDKNMDRPTGLQIYQAIFYLIEHHSSETVLTQITAQLGISHNVLQGAISRGPSAAVTVNEVQTCPCSGR